MAQTIEVTLHCPALGADLLVTSATVVEAISEPTCAEVHLLLADDADGESAIGKAAHLAASIDGQPARHYHFVVAAVRFDAVSAADGLWNNRRRYVVELWHELRLLSLRADVRMFQEKDAQEIALEVLEGGGVPAADVTFSLARTPGKRTYCVQHRETDLSFVSRLLEFEGIFYVIRDDDGGTHVTFADAQSAFTPIEGETSIRPVDDGHHGAGVRDFFLESKIVPEQVTLCDYNFATPAVDLTNTKEGVSGGAGGYFEYPGGYQKGAEGTALAKIRMEEIFANRTVGHGFSDRASFQAGSWFQLEEASRDALSTKYLLRRVEHRFVPVPLEGARALVYENRFECIPHETPFRPQRRAPLPRLRGTESVVATGPSGAEIHTDKLGRMKGKFFWDRLGKDDDTSSCWIRLAQLPIGGSMALARVGWEMTVTYFHGDPDRPLAVSRLYTAERPSPYGYPAAATRMSLQTASSPASGKINEIRMEDGGGGMEFFVNAAKDYDAATNNDKTETIGVDETRSVGVDEEITVGASETVSIGASLSTSVSADAGLQITGDRTKDVGAAETVTVGADAKVTVDGSDSETTGGSHTTLATMSVGRTSTGSHSLTVGGSMVSAAGLGVSLAVGGAKSETVGGAKIAASASSITDSIVGALAITVGGVRVQAAGGSRIGSAKGSSVITVGGIVAANAGGQVSIKGAKVAIKVLGVANFLGGGGVVNLTPGSAAFVGLVTLDAPTIKISGNPNLVG